MVIAQRISSHRQPGLSCSLSVFGIEITVVENIYTDIYICINIHIYVYISVYTHIYASSALAISQCRCFANIAESFSLIWSRA